jgi:hypothetical protein
MATDTLNGPSRETIIETLKDDKEYYRGLGRKFLSNSDIGSLLSNPKNFGKQTEDNKALAEGRYFHQLLIEPEKAVLTPFVDVSTRTTKEYKNFCEDNNLPFCMLKKEMDEVGRMAATMKANISFYDEIYKAGNQYEVPSYGEIQGMEWKGKADIITDESIIDLKTTSDISSFKWSAKKYNYDSQCYIYQQLFGKPLVFYVVDKITFQLGVFVPTENFVRSGEAKVSRAIEVYNRYFGPNATDDINNYYICEELD